MSAQPGGILRHEARLPALSNSNPASVVECQFGIIDGTKGGHIVEVALGMKSVPDSAIEEITPPAVITAQGGGIERAVFAHILG